VTNSALTRWLKQGQTRGMSPLCWVAHMADREYLWDFFEEYSTTEAGIEALQASGGFCLEHAQAPRRLEVEGLGSTFGISELYEDAFAGIVARLDRLAIDARKAGAESPCPRARTASASSPPMRATWSTCCDTTHAATSDSVSRSVCAFCSSRSFGRWPTVSAGCSRCSAAPPRACSATSRSTSASRAPRRATSRSDRNATTASARCTSPTAGRRRPRRSANPSTIIGFDGRAAER
jgi:hypothetical protein